MKSAEYKSVDRQLYIHELAFKTMTAKAQKQVGKKTKSVYRSFKDFFNYEEELHKVEGKVDNTKISSRFKGLAEYVSKKQKARKGQ